MIIVKPKRSVSRQLKTTLSVKICSWLNKWLNKCVKSYFRNWWNIKSVPDSYKNQEMYNKAVDNYPHTFQFIPKFFIRHLWQNCFWRSFLIIYCPDKYKTYSWLILLQVKWLKNFFVNCMQMKIYSTLKVHFKIWDNFW